MKWYIVFFIIIFSCFGVSYMTQEMYKWSSTMLQSCGVGVLTGLVVFILGNIRQNEREDVEKKIEKLRHLRELRNKVYNAFPEKSVRTLDEKEKEYEYYLYEIMEKAKDYISEIRVLNYHIDVEKATKEIRELQNSIDEMEKLTHKEILEIRRKVIDIIQKDEEWLENQLNEGEMQKRQLSKYPF